MTKVEIDTKWQLIHNMVSKAYYILSEEKRRETYLLWQKYHTWVVFSWDAELTQNGYLEDTWLDGEYDDEGVLITQGTFRRSQMLGQIVADSILHPSEKAKLKKNLEVEIV